MTWILFFSLLLLFAAVAIHRKALFPPFVRAKMRNV